MAKNHLPSQLWVQISPGTLDSFMSGSYPATLQNIGGSEIIQGGAPEVFL